MKKNSMIVLAVILMFLNAGVLTAGEDIKGNAIEIVSDYSYQLHSSDSAEVYQQLCLFAAKYKAVALAAKYLVHDGLLPDYGKRQKEIFCLAADGIDASILDSTLDDTPKKYSIKIKAVIQVTDFTKAEVKNNEFETMEKKFSWKEEMEQHVFTAIAPGKELSRAYRYLRQRHWRIAIIYLNHLEKKYPNWNEIYFAKAIGFYAINNKTEMMDALNKSCALGHSEACEDVKGFLNYDENIQAFKQKN